MGATNRLLVLKQHTEHNVCEPAEPTLLVPREQLMSLQICSGLKMYQRCLWEKAGSTGEGFLAGKTQNSNPELLESSFALHAGTSE